MITIALVEDDSKYRKAFTEYLKRYEAETGQQFRISVFADGREVLRDYRPGWDIILMDIAMPEMDGMTAAEKIRETDQDVIIIFMTNMPQYAMKGYTVEALDYVLKPVTYFAFTQRIEKAVSRLKKRSRNYLAINFHGGLKRLDVGEITYVEVLDHDLVYHVGRETYTTRGTLAEAEKSLKDAPFFRVNKSFLINLEYAEGVRQNEVIVAGDSVSVARARKKALMDALNDYMSGAGK